MWRPKALWWTLFAGGCKQATIPLPRNGDTLSSRSIACGIRAITKFKERGLPLVVVGRNFTKIIIYEVVNKLRVRF
jgi:hypothetical protein